MFKLIRRMAMFAVVAGAVGYFVKRRTTDDVWDAEQPEGDYGMKQYGLQRK